MRNFISIFLFALLLSSCGEQSSEEITEETAEVKSSLELSIDHNLQHVKFDFYTDSVGNVYHRVVDLTSGTDESGIYRYHNYARFYDGAETDNFERKELKDLVDLASFQRSEKIDPTGRTVYFEDVNNTYYFFAMAEGGTLAGRPKQNIHSPK